MIRVAFGAFELDEARFELRRRGEVVAVQPKALELIVYLARHRSRVVSKDELFEHVWEGALVTDASLSQAVSLARRALDDTPKHQWAIRTVRGRGLQFVADLDRKPPPPREPAPRRFAGTTLETEEARPGEARAPGSEGYLVLAVDPEALGEGGASWPLVDIDEVRIGRGSRRRAEVVSGRSRMLELSIPGRLVSREHATMMRTTDGWVLVDRGSRNGTYADGKRIDKLPLEPGQRFALGRVRFAYHEGPAPAPADHPSILATVLPELLATERDLLRLAPTDVPLLILGESGTGKTTAAEALHVASGRGGSAVSLEAATIRREGDLGELNQIPRGTLLLENVEQVGTDLIPWLIRALEQQGELRVIATSTLGPAEARARIPPALLARVAGFQATLPPLRARLDDLGTLIAVDPREANALADDTLDAFFDWSWPGNLRELSHTMSAASGLAEGGPIRREHLPAVMQTPPPQKTTR